MTDFELMKDAQQNAGKALAFLNWCRRHQLDSKFALNNVKFWNQVAAFWRRQKEEAAK